MVGRPKSETCTDNRDGTGYFCLGRCTIDKKRSKDKDAGRGSTMKILQGLIIASMVMVNGAGCDSFFRSEHDAAAPDVVSPDIRKCVSQMEGICWDAPSYPYSNVIPLVGTYSVAPLTADDDIAPLDTLGFVVVGTTSWTSVDFRQSQWWHDVISVAGGNFSHVHGGDLDGTVCPAEGYILSGSFVSPTQATGYFKYIPDCYPSKGGNFIATLVPTQP